MPICDIRFENGIFFAREHGRIETVEAEGWASALRNLARASHVPIVALVDALDATHVSAGARAIFTSASKTPNVKVISVATREVVVTQSARVMGLMGERGRTYVFNTLEEARRFAEMQINYIASLE